MKRLILSLLAASLVGNVHSIKLDNVQKTRTAGSVARALLTDDSLEDFQKKLREARDMEEKMTAKFTSSEVKDPTLGMSSEKAEAGSWEEEEVQAGNTIAGRPVNSTDQYLGERTGVRIPNDKFKYWVGLSDKEKNYAYYLSEASNAGALMVYHQISYESPPLFLLLSAYFQDKNVDNLMQSCVSPQKAPGRVGSKTFSRFVLYTAGFFDNMSPYNSFGSKKFVPEVSQAQFETLLKCNPLFKQESEKGELYRKIVSDVYPQIKDEIFAFDKPYSQLGFPEEGAVTGYFSRNMLKGDLKLVKEFLDQNEIDVLNTRVFMENGRYVVTVGSIDTSKSKKGIQFKGKIFDLEYGEFSEYLKMVVENLGKAIPYAANQREKDMLSWYIKAFTSGNMEDHKKSQRYWIKDMIPTVEMNMGWIEHYTDPTNQRAIWNGWVAIVNKKRTENFTKLVHKSDKIIPLLPWDKELEKPRFLAPDFTSLDMLIYAGEGLPSGINIPNYQDIKENEGFKNLVIEDDKKPLNRKTFYPLDHITTNLTSENIQEVQRVAETLQTAGHELFGHGSGRAIFKDEKTGKCPMTFTDPISGESYASCYNKGEKFSDKWGEIATSYEECKADVAGMYLLNFKDMWSDFGIEVQQLNKEAGSTDLLLAQLYAIATGGLDALPGSYNSDLKKWKQAHSQARFVIFQFIVQNQNPEKKVVEFDFTRHDGKIADYTLTFHRENVPTEGFQLVKKLLLTLQTYKSSAAVDKATAFYQKYSDVSPKMSELRDAMAAQAGNNNGMVKLWQGISKNGNRTPTMVEYPKKLRSVIYAKVDEFQMNQELYDKVMNEWSKHKDGQRVITNGKKASEASPQSAVDTKDSTPEPDAEMKESIQEANEEAMAAGE